MASEATANTQIFFKDKNNELKGPFAERQVQEWYRKKWFENSFPFYFMTGDERPNEYTAFHTLETLKSVNGTGCPFKSIESSGESGKEKLARLEKELVDLSKKCGDVKHLQSRVEEVEKRLMELSTQKSTNGVSSAAVAARKQESVQNEETVAPISSSAVNAGEKTDPRDAKKHIEWADQWTSYYLDVLEAFKTGKKEKVGGKRAQQMHELMTAIHKSELARKQFREMLQTKLKQLDYFYCASCDAIFQTDKQILMHTMEPTHIKEDQSGLHNGLLSLLGPMLTDILDAQEKIVNGEHSKYGSLDGSAKHLRPTLDFVDQFTLKYGNAVCDYMGGLNLNRAQIVSKMMPRLKKLDQMGRNMVKELHEHIGDNQTRCYECNKVTGSREEYYTHLRTHSHLKTGNAMDLITLVVNKYKKE